MNNWRYFSNPEFNKVRLCYEPCIGRHLSIDENQTKAKLESILPMGAYYRLDADGKVFYGYHITFHFEGIVKPLMIYDFMKFNRNIRYSFEEFCKPIKYPQNNFPVFQPQ